ncbi:MAG: ABC transporter permease [Firmicutes bacterium]|nr:ABC transporter permease [Bacillota bacterium]
MNRKKLFFGIFIAAALIVLYTPILLIIVFAFSESGTISLSSFEFGFANFRELFTDTRILTAIFNTLFIATVAAFLATVIGTMASVGMLKMKRRAQSGLMALNLTPLINATIVTSFSLVLMFATLGMLSMGYIRLILAHTLVALPIVMIIVLPKLRNMDNSLFDAAMDLGAKPSQALLKVVIPQLMPALIGAFLVGFTISVDEFIITNFNNSGIDTIPTLVYARFGFRVQGVMRALSALVFLAIFVALVIVNARMSRKKRSASAG